VAVGVATGYGLDGRGVGIRDFSSLHSVQTGSEAHPASYLMGTGSKAVPRSRIRGSIHSLPHTSSWSSASVVKHSDNVTNFTRVAVNISLTY
jgi:hypothetical protein